MKELNILILDDEHMLLDLLTMMLQPHSSTICGTLSEAQLLIDANPQAFDVMLCDIMMPKGGGLDLYAWLGEHHPELQNRLIFVTGGVGQALVQAIKDTDRPVLNKPFSIAQLHERLQDFL